MILFFCNLYGSLEREKWIIFGQKYIASFKKTLTVHSSGKERGVLSVKFSASEELHVKVFLLT